jgi:hypothetical protein
LKLGSQMPQRGPRGCPPGSPNAEGSGLPSSLPSSATRARSGVAVLSAPAALDTMAAGVNYAELHVPISGKIQLTNEPSHSLYQRNRLECLLCIATRSVVAVSLVYWSAAACAMHTTHFPAPDSGRSTSCSSAFRVNVAPRCLLHELDQSHGVVVHFPVSLSLMATPQSPFRFNG